MGVLPLEFADGASWQSLGLKGDETASIKGLADLNSTTRSSPKSPFGTFLVSKAEAIFAS